MNQPTRPLEAILDDCLTAVLEEGHKLTDCLQQHADRQDDLEPLLHLALRLQTARSVQPAPEFRQVAAIRMQNMLAARPRVRRVPIKKARPRTTLWQKIGAFSAPRRQLAWARVLGLVLLFGLSLSAMTVFAAGDALPGQALYPVKQVVENTQVRLTFAAAEKAELHLSFAGKRMQETAVLLDSQRTAKIGQTLAAYRNEIETAVAYLGTSGELTALEKESFARLLSTHLAEYETQLTLWQAQLTSAQEIAAEALQTSQEGRAKALAVLGLIQQNIPDAPIMAPTPGSTAAPTSTPAPTWAPPPFWPAGCPSPLDWPEEWPEDCEIPIDWPPDWPEPPGGWPVLPLPTGTVEPPAEWTPPPYWPPECPVPQKWPFSWPEACVLPTSYPPDWTAPPGGWPELSTPVPIPTVTVPPDWPQGCPLPQDWPDEWEAWPDACEIPPDFEWPDEWPAPPEGWPAELPPTNDWVESPDELPPPPDGFPDLPEEGDEPPPWPWP